MPGEGIGNRGCAGAVRSGHGRRPGYGAGGGGQQTPASADNHERFAALRSLDEAPTQGAEATQKDGDRAARADKLAKDGKLVPVLIDNIEALGYVAERRPSSGTVGGLPAVLMTKPLLPHQTAGLKWLQENWVSGAPGALLADDMGLGKTLQTLAFLAWLQERMEAGDHAHKPFLIVAPSGLLKNWEAECEKRLAEPGLNELIRAHGATLREIGALGGRTRTRRLAEAGWVVTTYETLRDKIEVFLNVEWAAVAFDEVQKIKNPGSRTTEMAKSLKADFTLALTGTPVENSLSGLWSIVDACYPGMLGSLKEFANRYQKPAEEQADQEAMTSLKHALEKM